jgi:DNA topoisomerase-1
MLEGFGDIDAREVNTIDVGDGIVLRVGKFGPYVERPAPPGAEGPDGGDPAPQRASVPEDLPPDELTVAKAEELLAAPSGDRELGVDPATGHTIVAKAGRYGPYVTEVLPADAPKGAKPRTGSLFKDMGLDTVDLATALRLLSLPRVVGADESGEEITAQNGRYGPYLKKGADSRSLESEDQLFEITLEQALAIYAQPKTYGRRAAAGPLRELGADPVSGKPIVVKDGRFGAYVTDGETNATLRKADSVESVTVERAAELLAEKRAKGPAPKKRAAKKAPAKKAAAKKPAAKKAPAKKAAAKP